MTKSLENKIIIGLKIAKDKQALLVQTTTGDVLARVDGDCCSHSWIEAVELPAGGFPATVISSGVLDMNKEDLSNEDFDCLRFYGYKIQTDKGDIIIDYRNSSNGYYGGSINWPDDDYYYGGVHGQNISAQEWEEIKDASK